MCELEIYLRPCLDCLSRSKIAGGSLKVVWSGNPLILIYLFSSYFQIPTGKLFSNNYHVHQGLLEFGTHEIIIKIQGTNLEVM